MDSVPYDQKFAVIKELTMRGYCVLLLCQLAQVSRSGYYKWVKRQEIVSPKQLEDQQLKWKITECCKEVKGIYGYRRVKVWIEKKYGLKINRKRVQRLMNVMGIQAVIRKKRPYYGKKEVYVVSENLLNRDFHASRPNEKWVTDITYLIFNGQRLYLSVIKDLYNNEIIAYQISRRNDLKLVVDTLKQAKKKRNVHGILLHSDQGFQYTSRQYNNLLKRYKMIASMSRKGNCWDNACMENFFSHFKSECFDRYSFRTSEEVKHAVQRYIYFYNHKRFQQKLNNLSPYEYRTQVA
ncbi:IS3 family transposase [Brevibacillus nitrificans]|uniref:IS3 family transposase n=1 Tax=Brevibacillus nitrificans TaxID=651560 RepID=UPI00285F4B50|nr:IS3 family transposase [Brevibacillus nitrificans]MDR7319745.1 transposase InsO family protein [Brevibacillus nitrificans]